MKETVHFLPDTAEEVMVRKIPTGRKSDTVGHILNQLAKESWDDIETVYITSEEEGLLGIIPIHQLLISERSESLGKIMHHVRYKVGPHTDQEKLVIEAIHRDVTSVPVTDHENRLIGAVTSDKMIDILHDEHLEDLLHTSGIHGKISHMSDLITAKLHNVVLARLPWLIVGLGIGFVASFVVSQFEAFLNQNVALAFFISMVAYMSGAINTQSEIIFIRALTVMRFNVVAYFIREFSIGVIMGAIIGLLGGIGSYLLSSSVQIAFTVGLALLISMSLATMVACLVPLLLRSWGKDPAIGSGPFATAIQDLISISIYFTVSLLILGNM
jgi:magnesium transporter